MGRISRQMPQRLAEKLLLIRLRLNLSQAGMAKLLRCKGLSQSIISGYERGIREPSLIVLAKYADLAGVCTDVLIRDNLDLPTKMPSKPHHKQRA
jgi:transcriptional regulator with XRE-family HTH domain